MKNLTLLAAGRSLNCAHHDTPGAMRCDDGELSVCGQADASARLGLMIRAQESRAATSGGPPAVQVLRVCRRRAAAAARVVYSK